MSSIEAMLARHEMLTELRLVVEMCKCEWPLVKYRNGDGHAPECPAHIPIGERHRRDPK